ncbi:MAG: MFS transporter [Chloroflexi bacterium]|nr:MFS transporter [Chloroflexota bacterium]
MSEIPSKPEILPPVRTDVAYSFINLGTTIVWSIVDGWLLYFYLPPDGQGMALVPVALYGMAVLSGRILNALFTPLIGYWSDHSRSRWGRRLPFIFLSSLPYLIFFVLLWLPPVKGESLGNLVYLAVILVLFNLAQSLVVIPFGSLLPELARADRHRVRMTAWSASFQLIGVILAGLAGLLIEQRGFVFTMLIYALAILPLFYLPLLVLREQPGRQIKVGEHLGFWRSIKITLANRAFLVLTATGACFWTATTFLMLVVPFIVTEVCGLTVADTPYFYLPAVLASLACYPLVNGLAGRFGKWRVFAASLLASAVILPLLMLIGPWIPIPLMAQGITWMTLEAIAMSGVIMLPQAFAAEITDYDETVTGQRREGAYYSAWSLLDQMVNGLAGAALPLLLLLGRSRTDDHGPLGVRLTGLIGGLLLFAAFLIFQRYPLKNFLRVSS